MYNYTLFSVFVEIAYGIQVFHKIIISVCFSLAANTFYVFPYDFPQFAYNHGTDMSREPAFSAMFPSCFP